MPYGVAADALVVVHLGFVGFVAFGGMLVWRWPRLAWLHVPAVVWAVGIEWSEAICPLTPWEQWLRAEAGGVGYEGDFIGRYLLPVLYPAGLTRTVQLALGGIALGVNAAAYGWLWRRSMHRRPGRGAVELRRSRDRVHRHLRGVWFVASLAVGGLAVACGAPSPDVAETTFDVSTSASHVGAARAPEETARPRIVVLGDSLTAGLGVAAEEAYPALLQSRIDATGLELEVVNAGVSGDTTAGGLRRLAWSLDGNVRLLLVALGGNDALRGLPVEQMRTNLAAIIEQAAARGVRVVLAGMEAPPNFGGAYTSEFRDVFRQLAETYDVVLVPFLLEGVAGVAELNQADGIHPNATGAKRVADHLWPVLEPLLADVAAEARSPAG